MNTAVAPEAVFDKENIGRLANFKSQHPDQKRPMLKDIQQNDQSLQESSQIFKSNSPPTMLQKLCQHLDPIIDNLTAQENVESQVDSEYMSRQKDINQKMRAILVDWLVDVNLKFRLKPQSLFMAISVIDRFLSLREVSRAKLQLVGISALMLVGKYEEIYPPLLRDYVAVCDNAYKKEELLAMEEEILSVLDFQLNRTSSLVFLELFRQKISMTDQNFAFCRYFLEIALMDLAHLQFKNSVLAAGAIYLSHKVFRKESWPKGFDLTTKVSESAAKSCAKELFAILSRVESTKLGAIRTKFAHPDLFEVSKYRIEKVSSNSTTSIAS